MSDRLRGRVPRPHEVTVVLVGDSGVGKTALVTRFCEDIFIENYAPTTFNRYISDTLVANKRVRFTIWDTSGSKEANSSRTLAAREADVLLVCYKISDPTSLFSAIDHWVPELRSECPSTPILLVGCQTDLRTDPDVVQGLAKIGKHPVTSQQGLCMSQQISAVMYLETSSKTSVRGVSSALEVAALTALGQFSPPPPPPTALVNGGGGRLQSGINSATPSPTHRQAQQRHHQRARSQPLHHQSSLALHSPFTNNNHPNNSNNNNYGGTCNNGNREAFTYDEHMPINGKLSLAPQQPVHISSSASPSAISTASSSCSSFSSQYPAHLGGPHTPAGAAGCGPSSSSSSSVQSSPSPLISKKKYGHRNRSLSMTRQTYSSRSSTDVVRSNLAVMRYPPPPPGSTAHHQPQQQCVGGNQYQGMIPAHDPKGYSRSSVMMMMMNGGGMSDLNHEMMMKDRRRSQSPALGRHKPMMPPPPPPPAPMLHLMDEQPPSMFDIEPSQTFWDQFTAVPALSVHNDDDDDGQPEDDDDDSMLGSGLGEGRARAVNGHPQLQGKRHGSRCDLPSMAGFNGMMPGSPGLNNRGRTPPVGATGYANSHQHYPLMGVRRPRRRSSSSHHSSPVAGGAARMAVGPHPTLMAMQLGSVGTPSTCSSAGRSPSLNSRNGSNLGVTPGGMTVNGDAGAAASKAGSLSSMSIRSKSSTLSSTKSDSSMLSVGHNANGLVPGGGAGNVAGASSSAETSSDQNKNYDGIVSPVGQENGGPDSLKKAEPKQAVAPAVTTSTAKPNVISISTKTPKSNRKSLPSGRQANNNSNTNERMVSIKCQRLREDRTYEEVEIEVPAPVYETMQNFNTGPGGANNNNNQNNNHDGARRPAGEKSRTGGFGTKIKCLFSKTAS